MTIGTTEVVSGLGGNLVLCWWDHLGYPQGLWIELAITTVHSERNLYPKILRELCVIVYRCVSRWYRF